MSTILKNIQNKLPFIRDTTHTKRQLFTKIKDSQIERQTKLEIYYETLNNWIIKRCCEVYKDTTLNQGFTIKSDTLEKENPYITNYLYNLFNNPEGISGDLSYNSLISLIWDSSLVLGDAFFEVSTDSKYGIFNGFKYIPNTDIYYSNQNDCYSLYSNPKVQYEPKELIHIYQRNPRKEYSKFGVSVIDSAGSCLALLINALSFNNKILLNKGLSPDTFISFDKDISDTNFLAEVERLAAQFKEKEDNEVMFIRGASFEKGSSSNNEMSYLELMKFTRDAVIARFGIPPQKFGYVETANLGSGSGDSQAKDWKTTFEGKSTMITDAFNSCLRYHGFSERFTFNSMDITDDLYQAQVDEIYLRNNVKTVDEVRNNLGMDKLPVNTWEGYYL